MITLNRAYPAVSDRQQDADRLIYSEADLRRVLGLQIAGAPTATIRLGGDIILSAPLALSGSYDIVVDGGGRWSLICAATFTATEMLQLNGSVANILFRDMGFTGPTTKLERLATLGSSMDDVSFERITLTNIKRVHQSTSTKLYRSSHFVDLTFLGLQLSDITDIGSAQYQRCHFERCYALLPSLTTRTVSVSDAAGSTDLVMIEAGPPTSTSAVSLQDFAQSQLYLLNVVRQLTAGQVVYSPATLSLSTANPTLSPGSTSYLQLTMTSGASGSITMDTLGAVAGQVLVMEVVSNAGTASIPDNIVNNVRLTAAWNPIGGQTLTLIFNGTFWIETARANN